jgi:hypothetical protein
MIPRAKQDIIMKGKFSAPDATQELISHHPAHSAVTIMAELS